MTPKMPREGFVTQNSSKKREKKKPYKQASVSTVLDLTAVVAEITLEAGLRMSPFS